MTVQEFIAKWGFVSFRETSTPGYIQATFADPGQKLKDGHHCRHDNAETALDMLDAYLCKKRIGRSDDYDR